MKRSWQAFTSALVTPTCVQNRVAEVNSSTTLLLDAPNAMRFSGKRHLEKGQWLLAQARVGYVFFDYFYHG